MFKIPLFDDLSDDQLHQIFLDWANGSSPLVDDYESLDQIFNSALPRTRFFKSLPTNAEILDLGAGDGSLAIYKTWPQPERTDLSLYAVSLSQGEHFNLYESVEIKNFEEDSVFENREFDAVVCCHFIEHMQTPDATIEFFARKTRPGGRIYLEWPHEIAKRLPVRTRVEPGGISVSTMNFHDDTTHVEAWSADKIVSLLNEHGLQVEAGGRVYLPWMAEQMRNYARLTKDSVRMTIALWAAVGWSQFLIVSKPLSNKR